MLVLTTFTIEGYSITDYYGVVRGVIVRSPTIWQGMKGSISNVLGGKIGAYTDMCDKARQQSYDLMVAHAKSLGANAIVGMHYDASDLGSYGATEVLCYGTAVLVKQIK